ncbi:unnamed protein product [Heterobilharzia americana]|nr:unnamed protein product [Heterobilharzia americana]
MRVQFDEIEGVAKQTQNKGNQYDDPLLLKIALDQARKAQAASEFEVVQLKAEYVNVMPKKRYDMLMEENVQVKSKYDNKVREYEDLNESFGLLKTQLSEVIKQRDASEITLHELQKVSTPRPEWNEVGRKLPGGLTKWLEETESMTSQEKMHFLVNQLTLQTNEDNEFNLNEYIKEELNFTPSFLLTEGNVNFRQMQLRDCLLMTHELWTARKNERDETKMKAHPPTGTQSKLSTSHQQKHLEALKPFDQFVNHFFKQIYGIEQIRIEWAYTFYSMLVREKSNYKLIELKMIINNKMDEECHWHLESWLKSIKEQILIFIDSNYNNNSHGNTITPLLNMQSDQDKQKLILQQTLYEALLNIFGQRNLNKLDKLIQSASEYASLRTKESSNLSSYIKEETNSNLNQVNIQHMIDFNKLFENTNDEDYNPFINELISIYKQMKTAFINDVVVELQKFMSTEAQSNSVTLAQLKNIIETISPSTAVKSNLRPKSGKSVTLQQPSYSLSPDIESSLKWIFRINPNESLVQSLPLNILIARLAGCNLFSD